MDTSFTIRPRSPLGLKYLELVRGSSDRAARDGHVFGTDQTTIPVQIDDFARTFDGRTRTAVQRNLQGFGNALAGRGQSVNTTIDQLPPLFGRLAPVARNLSDRRTRLGRLFREVGRTARVVAPVADHPGRPVHPLGASPSRRCRPTPTRSRRRSRARTGRSRRASTRSPCSARS